MNHIYKKTIQITGLFSCNSIPLNGPIIRDIIPHPMLNRSVEDPLYNNAVLLSIFCCQFFYE
jgi:hypothetical protein